MYNVSKGRPGVCAPGLFAAAGPPHRACTEGHAAGGTGPARVGWHAAGHETRAAGCFAVGSQGLNGGFPRATRTVERLAETNPLKNSIFFAKEGVQPGKIAEKLRKSEKKP